MWRARCDVPSRTGWSYPGIPPLYPLRTRVRARTLQTILHGRLRRHLWPRFRANMRGNRNNRAFLQINNDKNNKSSHDREGWFLPAWIQPWKRYVTAIRVGQMGRVARWTRGRIAMLRKRREQGNNTRDVGAKFLHGTLGASINIRDSKKFKTERRPGGFGSIRFIGFFASPSVAERITAADRRRSGNAPSILSIVRRNIWNGLPSCAYLRSRYASIENERDHVAIFSAAQQRPDETHLLGKATSACLF